MAMLTKSNQSEMDDWPSVVRFLGTAVVSALVVSEVHDLAMLAVSGGAHPSLVKGVGLLSLGLFYVLAVYFGRFLVAGSYAIGLALLVVVTVSLTQAGIFGRLGTFEAYAFSPSGWISPMVGASLLGLVTGSIAVLRFKPPRVSLPHWLPLLVSAVGIIVGLVEWGLIETVPAARNPLVVQTRHWLLIGFGTLYMIALVIARRAENAP